MREFCWHWQNLVQTSWRKLHPCMPIFCNDSNWIVFFILFWPGSGKWNGKVWATTYIRIVWRSIGCDIEINGSVAFVCYVFFFHARRRSGKGHWFVYLLSSLYSGHTPFCPRFTQFALSGSTSQCLLGNWVKLVTSRRASSGCDWLAVSGWSEAGGEQTEPGGGDCGGLGPVWVQITQACPPTVPSYRE